LNTPLAQPVESLRPSLFLSSGLANEPFVALGRETMVIEPSTLSCW